ncbi:hypothetical protein Pan216_29070 [Planctomycetes bacterium Pan216]|uniref:Uncharacterized protein n=1 Tax=Kolteria novifilia TaxID=2527975 RepID=A0A518B4Y5_9BACT|nr:hypothetical protein Pan216_29070 [Planctomycetes bacterium Pan216]
MSKNMHDILEATATMVDKKLEPTDHTTYLVTVKNKSCRFTANNVAATVTLKGGGVDGLTLTPDDRYFGNISPGRSVTKEFSINTERVTPGDYELCSHFNFTASFDKCEGEKTGFVVEED